MLRKVLRVEPMMQVGDVIRVRMHIVGTEPDGPERSGEPGMTRVARRRKLPGDIEIDHADMSAWLQHPPGVVDGGKPLGNHGQRI